MVISLPELVITLASEGVVMGWLSAYYPKNRWQWVGWSLVVNCLTQPLFYVFFTHILEGRDYLWIETFIVCEMIILFVEAIFYYFAFQRKVSMQQCFFRSIVTNFVSLGIGLCLPV